MSVEFVPFPKIGRLKRSCVISEKIDGSNAGIQIVSTSFEAAERASAVIDGLALIAQSRNRIITPGDDNFGFARWVAENAPALVALGEGVHFGEWWGSGIQRGYGVQPKRFSLFNSARWSDERGERPACCHVVPVLYQGEFTTGAVDETMAALEKSGSVAAPGHMKPEGVIVYHVATKTYFKRTFEKDDAGKEYGA